MKKNLNFESIWLVNEIKFIDKYIINVQYVLPHTNDFSASFSERVNGINNMFLWLGTPGTDYYCFQLARQDLRICFFCGELSNSLQMV